MSESICKVKFIRQSPYKVRFVLDSIRGKKVEYALDFLDFSNKKAAKFISKASALILRRLNDIRVNPAVKIIINLYSS